MSASCIGNENMSLVLLGVVVFVSFITISLLGSIPVVLHFHKSVTIVQ